MKKYPYCLDETRSRDIVIFLMKHRIKKSRYDLELILHISRLMTY